MSPTDAGAVHGNASTMREIMVTLSVFERPLMASSARARP
jgi:hypothetical protein